MRPTSVSPQVAAMASDLSRRLFDKLDRDHDGRVTRQEMHDAGILKKVGVARTDEEETRTFDGIDANHDDSLSESESFSYFSSLMQASPEALVAITAELAKDPEEERSPEELANRLKQETAPRDEPTDPSSPDGKRQAERALRLTPAYNLALAEDALRRAAAGKAPLGTDIRA